MNPNDSQNNKVWNKDKNCKTIPIVQFRLLGVGAFTQSVQMIQYSSYHTLQMHNI